VSRVSFYNVLNSKLFLFTNQPVNLFVKVEKEDQKNKGKLKEQGNKKSPDKLKKQDKKKKVSDDLHHQLHEPLDQQTT
jgi:hypothetical protein